MRPEPSIGERSAGGGSARAGAAIAGAEMGVGKARERCGRKSVDERLCVERAAVKSEGMGVVRREAVMERVTSRRKWSMSVRVLGWRKLRR